MLNILVFHCTPEKHWLSIIGLITTCLCLQILCHMKNDNTPNMIDINSQCNVHGICSLLNIVVIHAVDV